MKTCTMLGLVGCVLGCVCLYLTSSNQRWSASAWPARWARPARLAGVLLLPTSWMAFVQDMRALTATFLWVTTLMWMLAMLPYVGAWRALQREGKA